ncbi:MAG: F0F1 ATP synthase subunit epsilon [Deltaproteobacteria bacterium]|nr:F0F1 ATP synthase subunit epsilon [Deltaproteobacteria bacterium]
MADIYLEIVTPERVVVGEQAQTVTAPGSEGEFGVLPGHTPFLTSLQVGSLRYKDASGAERCVFVSKGFAEVLPDRVTVLAQSGERRSDIDIERARQAMKRAQERLESGAPDVDFERAKAALLRAQHRLSLAESRAAARMSS